jgi:uncharacterized membrane protein (DUF441 family)
MFGKGSWIVVGVLLIIAGALLKSNLIEWLLDFTGWIMIIVGIVVVIIGLIGLATGRKGGSDGF